jgi:hypothetical protein
LTSRDEDILFVEVANVLNVGGSHGVEVVGIAVGFVAEERIGRGGLNYGIGGVLGGEFVGLSDGVGVGLGSVIAVAVAVASVEEARVRGNGRAAAGANGDPPRPTAAKASATAVRFW